MGSAVSDPGQKGWLVSILELGAWFGALCTGYLVDRLSRKYTILLGEWSTYLYTILNIDFLYKRLSYFVLGSPYRRQLRILRRSLEVRGFVYIDLFLLHKLLAKVDS